jgi:NADPH:quinone reductase
MKAIILKEYGSADNFEMIDIPIPEIKKGEVRIRIIAVSFNPVDYQIRKGLAEGKFVKSNILGRDLSGVVEEVGENVTDFIKGDEVYSYVCNLASSGTYTEYISVPSALVWKKPISLSHEEAASVPVAGITAWLALNKIKNQTSKNIFIAGGADGVGSFAIMFAKTMSFQSIVTTAGNEKSHSHLVQNLHLSPEQIINYKSVNFIEKSIEVNNGYFDSAFDLVGGEMLSACCELLSIDGNLASITEAPNQSDFDKLFHKNASFHSIGANAYSLSENQVFWKKYQYILNEISKLFDSPLIPKPLITNLGSLSIDTVKTAHYLLENNLVQGKLIMTC